MSAASPLYNKWLDYGGVLYHWTRSGLRAPGSGLRIIHEIYLQTAKNKTQPPAGVWSWTLSVISNNFSHCVLIGSVPVSGLWQTKTLMTLTMTSSYVAKQQRHVTTTTCQCTSARLDGVMMTSRWRRRLATTTETGATTVKLTLRLSISTRRLEEVNYISICDLSPTMCISIFVEHANVYKLGWPVRFVWSFTSFWSSY